MLAKATFTIGRDASSDLPLTNTEISRDHAEIMRLDDRYVVRDRGSRYGTFVNGAQIDSDHSLADGDRIRLGRGTGVELRFLVGDDVAASGESSPSGGFRQVSALLEALQALGGARVVDEVLALVLDAALDITGAERGFIMLANEEGELEFKLARGQGKVSLSGARFDISHKIPDDVFASGRDAFVADLREADLAGAHEGTLAFGIRHVLCVPLRIVRYVDRKDGAADLRAIGVLYLDSREKGSLLSRTARASLATLALEAAGAIENARLYREAMEKAFIDRDLRIASQIQQALLPPPRRTGRFFAAAAASIPCHEIGGDFFDYMDLPDGRFGFAIGDVAGKGTPAALLNAVLQGILTSEAAAMQEPNETMARINHALLARAIEARFATAFLATLSADGQLTYCNAGHNPPFVLADGAWKRLTVGGIVIGMFPNSVYQQQVVQLAPGDIVLLFSDGVSEALNAAGHEFGDERIVDAVRPVASASPQMVIEALLAAVKEFAAHALQHDDITALAVRYGANGPAPFTT
jgi:serine phosphatase RsbU (regulator of sigma subunit)